MVTPTKQEHNMEDTAKQPHASNVTAISLPSRLPPFWRENPRLWFAQFEAATASTKCSEEAKFNLVIPLLSYQDLEQAADVILSPPENGRYRALKTKLIAAYQDSEHQRLKKLIAGGDPGDLKPSQLWRKMKTLNGDLLSLKALEMMWLEQLPVQIRTSLATLSVDTEKLAETADRMAEILGAAKDGVQICAQETLTSLQHQVTELSAEIAALRRAQQRNEDSQPPRQRWGRNGARSQSPQKKTQLRTCWFHRTFGKKARKCIPPCNFTAEN